MKIIAIIPVWRRPEILNITAPLLPDWLDAVYVLSPDDPQYYENREIIEREARPFVEYQNFTVAEKMNVAFKSVKKYLEFDYIMNLGSDDVLNPTLIKTYQKHKDKLCMGFQHIHFMEFGGHCGYEYFSELETYGAGRLIHKQVLDKIEYLYPMHLNKGLDNASRKVIEQFTTVHKIKHHEPAVLDIKSEVNLNPIGYFKDQSKRVELDEVKKYFKI